VSKLYLSIYLVLALCLRDKKQEIHQYDSVRCNPTVILKYECHDSIVPPKNKGKIDLECIDQELQWNPVNPVTNGPQNLTVLTG